MPSRLFYLSSLDESISIIRDVWLVFNHLALLQKPTDLDLHCLQRQGISVFSMTWVNYEIKFVTTYSENYKQSVA